MASGSNADIGTGLPIDNALAHVGAVHIYDIEIHVKLFVSPQSNCLLKSSDI